MHEITESWPALQKRIGDVNRAHGFREYTDSVRNDPEALARIQANALMLIVGEASEAHEELRKGIPVNETYYSGGYNEEDSMGNPNGPRVNAGKPEGVPSEIADIVIRCLDFADSNDFDLGAMVAEKIAYNETRPFKHGKKF